MAIARDKFWIFGVRPHQDDYYFGRGRMRKIQWSRITPAEGAMMLDVPNLAMINCDGTPAPFSCEAYGYAESFRRLKRVLWGTAGSGGFRSGNEEKFIVELAKDYPNLCGAFMDDWFGVNKVSDEECERTLRAQREELARASRPMEVWITWYFGAKAPAHLFEYIDAVTIWTWNWQGLKDLEPNFLQLERDLPRVRKVLGIYMFDFTTGEGVPLDMMEHQCEFGLRMMKEGRMDGLMFEANSVMGVGLESEKWLCDWIDRVKYMEVPD